MKLTHYYQFSCVNLTHRKSGIRGEKEELKKKRKMKMRIINKNNKTSGEKRTKKFE